MCECVCICLTYLILFSNAGRYLSKSPATSEIRHRVNFKRFEFSVLLLLDLLRVAGLNNSVIIKGFRTIFFIFLLFPQPFGRYLLRLPSDMCRTGEPTRNFELRPSLNPRGSPCSDSVSHNRIQVLSISVLLLASGQD